MPKHQKVVVRKSYLGKAVYSLRQFKPNAKVGKITGTVIEDANYGSDYCMECGEGRVMEAAAPFRFLNHSCDPNCELVIWQGESPADWELCLHSIKPIKPGDELTIDYAWQLNDAIPCLCQSEKCRGWIVAARE